MDEDVISDIVNRTGGDLNDIIIIGSGDHGKYPFPGGNHFRNLTPHIPNPLAYMHVYATYPFCVCSGTRYSAQQL